MSKSHFDEWFSNISGHSSPRTWQSELAAETSCRNRLIRIPTGLGKTEGVLAAWSLHRILRDDDMWPRRIVWCLPMRVLVEQTEEVARRLAMRMPFERRPEVHVAMGGEDAGEWFLYPERPAIIIGTQDMLLSRALNRGYASPRARWPVEFGLLSQDALWVIDEVQLMDVGLATTAQLQAFRDDDAAKTLRPCATWWMSATLQPEWLKTVDTAAHHEVWTQHPCTVKPVDRNGGVWESKKFLATDSIDAADAKTLAHRILSEHDASSGGPYGKITLVVCNTVNRAVSTFEALRAAGRKDGIELVHSRFRPAEREMWRDRFLSRSACAQGVDRIMVATQVVEAGVDISAENLVTDLAPWPSLVQRFGRCARYGGDGRVLVVDRGRGEGNSAPYESEELESAWNVVQAMKDVGLRSLEEHESSLSQECRATLYPYSPAQLVLRQEFDDLFDTSPDLAGADVDISRFIRSGNERDLQVFWCELDKHAAPPRNRRPKRRELCAVPFLDARRWLCGEETKTNRKPKLRDGMRAWVWDWLDGEWVPVARASLVPGRVVCVDAACGGYRTDRGFDPDCRDSVPPVVEVAVTADVQALDEADDRQDGENLSFEAWKTIACHNAEVAAEAGMIAAALDLPAALQRLLVLAGEWHDWGKSHPAFQGAMFGAERPDRDDLAKGPEHAWRRPPNMYRYRDGSEIRPAFRHELASALGLFALLQEYAPLHGALLGQWKDMLLAMGCELPTRATDTPSERVQAVLDCEPDDFNLLVYLVASHHGKVRMALQSAPRDQDYHDRDGRGLPIRGIRERDRLPEVILMPGTPPVPAITMALSPAGIGISARTGASWQDRCRSLQVRFGPAGLALLESALRAADVRASRLKTTDPELLTESKE